MLEQRTLLCYTHSVTSRDAQKLSEYGPYTVTFLLVTIIDEGSMVRPHGQMA